MAPSRRPPQPAAQDTIATPPEYRRAGRPVNQTPRPQPGKKDQTGVRRDNLAGAASLGAGRGVVGPEEWVEWGLADELGATGLKQFAGIIREELYPKLVGSLGTKTYKEMSLTDAVVRAALQAIDLTVRQVRWRVDPAGPSAADKEAAVFLESIREDMAHTWSDHISEAMTMPVYGWAFFEIVYKKRGGPTDDPHTSSRFDDGRIGVRKLAIRAQDTLFRWQFDPTGGIQGLIQRPPPDFYERAVPIDKALLYRTALRKNNPEGESLLRGAYRAWFYKKRIEEIQAIGIERDLAGLPLAEVPPELLVANPTTANAALLTSIKKIVTNIRNDEQAGIVFPKAYDAQGKDLFKISLLTTGGRRMFDTNAVMTYYDQRIAMALMADFLLLGHAKVGTQALGESKIGVFSTALGAYMDSIRDVLNRYLVPRLFALNGWDLEQLPRFEHEAVESADLADLGAYLANLAKAGMPLFPDPELQSHLKRVARLPVDAAPQTGEQAAEQEAEEGTAAPGQQPAPGQQHIPSQAAGPKPVPAAARNFSVETRPVGSGTL